MRSHRFAPALSAGLILCASPLAQARTEDDALSVDEIAVEDLVPGAKIGKDSFVQEVATENRRDLPDALEYEPGVDVVQGTRGQRKYLIRGFDMRQVYFKFEGVPLDSGYDGLNGMDRMPKNWLGKLVIKKSAENATDDLSLGGSLEASAYRRDGLSAGVGFDRHGFDASLRGGISPGKWHADATAALYDSEGWHLSKNFKASEYEDGGLRENSQSRGANALLRAERRFDGGGRLKLTAGFSRDSRGVVVGIDTGVPRFWIFPRWDIALATASYKDIFRYLYIDSQLWATYQGNRLDSYSDGNYDDKAESNDIFDFEGGGKFLVGSLPFDLGRAGEIDVSAQNTVRYTRRDTDNVYAKNLEDADELHASRITWEGKIGTSYRPIDNLGIFAAAAVVHGSDLSKPQKTLKNEGLVKLRDYKIDIGADYRIMENLRLSARIGRGMRFPTLKEQYQLVFRSDAERDYHLKSESVWNFEGQLTYAPFDFLSFNLAGFDKEVRDLIVFRNIDGLHRAVNVGKARMAGLEFLAAVGPFYGFELRGDYSYLYAHDLEIDRRLPGKSEHRANGTLIYRYGKLLFLSFNVHFESDKVSEDWTGFAKKTLGAIATLNAEAGFAFEGFKISAYVKNIADIHYSRAFGYPERGRHFYVGASVDL